MLQLQEVAVISRFFLAGFFLALLLCMATVAHARDAAALGDKKEFELRLQATSNELQQLEIVLEQTRQQRLELQARLQQHSGQLSERANRLQSLQKEIRQYEQQLEQLEARVEAQQAALADDRRQLALLLRQQLITKSAGKTGSTIKTALSGKNAILSQRKSVYISHLQSAQTDRIKEVQARLAQLQQARDEALKSRNWLAHLSRKAESQRNNINVKHSAARSKINQLETTEKNSSSERRKLLQEQQEITLMLEELAKLKSTASGYFKAQLGKLPWPVPGGEKLKVSARFGDAKAAGKLDWTGVLIKRKSGRPVTAIADGEVVYADLLAAMGIVVVLDHGDGYLSLYGGNSSSDVQPGDWIEMGSTIATVGRITGPYNEATYLEVRENAVPVDPERWLDAKKRVRLARN